jgi:glycosyltransferase involved in cell wall biosynthesis
MRILTYCDVAKGDIAHRLGTPEYSYHFVLEAFHQALEQFAVVQRIYAPETEADPIWEECLAAGEECLLLSFTPPYKLPAGLRCPTFPVFAWEYPDLPQGWEEKVWKSEARHDWRLVLNRAGAAITLSTHTAEAVKNALGQSYPILAVPTPLWEKFRVHRQHPPLSPQRRSVDIRMNIAMVDSNTLGLSAEGLVDVFGDDGTPSVPETDALLAPMLPGACAIWPPLATFQARREDSLPEDLFVGTGLVASGWDIPPRTDVTARLLGVVYTAVLTPSDGRKNWQDMITAFGWAFRDVEDATLVLKLGGPNLIWEHHQMLMLLTKLSPMKCRIVALHGYLDDADYSQLIGATTYYVNTSLCEGLCMPLMEFLCCGVPALAPDHTAMADYIDPDFAFVVDSTGGQPALWPHGDHQVYRSTRHRINWNSLMQAYRQSYQVAKNEPAVYTAMSASALQHMEAYCPTETIAKSLHDFLRPQVSRRGSAFPVNRLAMDTP